MKIILISVGIMRDEPLKQLCDRFAARIPHYMPFEAVVIPDVQASKNPNNEVRKAKEGDAIVSKISPGDFVVLLDERGREMTSRELAAFIDKKAATLSRNLVFVIGGPFGFSKDVYARADSQMCLSKMTFTHEMARTITLEQIYRALTILRGEPYHHD